jgi:hypothetical protein
MAAAAYQKWCSSWGWMGWVHQKMNQCMAFFESVRIAYFLQLACGLLEARHCITSAATHARNCF